MGLQALKIVEEVINQQIESITTKMDQLEEAHGSFYDMPLIYFQRHSGLSHQAAVLAISLDRIKKRIEAECIDQPEPPLSESHHPVPVVPKGPDYDTRHKDH